MTNLNEVSLSYRRFLRSFGQLFLGLLALAVGCESASKPSAGNNLAPGDFTAANYSTNVLHEGDRVTITFQFSTNFNTVDRVGLDGALNLDAVGKVAAAGKTPQDLEKDLTERYEPQTGKDLISVRVMVPAASIYVSGAVYKPGKVPLERPMTLLEAIEEAGGYDPNRAKLSEVTVLRLEDGRQKTYKFNLKQTLKGNNETPFFLRAFDIVHVPNKTFNF
jgi:polysaccharide export outer membrane protein